MADNVIRNDIIKLDFVTNLKELTKVTDGIDDLKKSVKGGVGDKEFEKLKDGANESVNPLKKVKEQAEKVTKAVTEIGKKAATTAFNGLKKLAGISFKATIAGIGAAATAIGGLAAKAVSAYADFEQLKGGVETLFKDSAGIVQKNANDAFKTAGLSVNDYMETVTGFSASLIQSCGGDTAKAAELANTAISDMSDNANKMGTDMGSIQNAYQGFAKQNYTMLDNLKLGYGGTKEEMERLVNDAAKIDKSVKKNDMSYANIVKAIHAVQVNMDIYGTTAKEAEKTISGSLGMVKAAWGNLLPALIQGGDSFDQCIENLIYSVKAFAKNIKPAILSALSGIGKLIEEIAPLIEEHLPTVIDELLPPLIKAAASLFAGLIRALPSIIKALVKELPGALKIVWDTILEVFGEQFPILYKIADTWKLIFAKIKEFFKKYGGNIKSIAKGFIDNLKERFAGLGTIFETTKELFGNPPDSITDFFIKVANAAKKLVPAIIGLVGAFKLFRKVKGVTSLIGGSKGKGADKSGGGLIGGFMNALKSIGSVKVGTVIKAMINLGIIIGALMALTALFIEIAPHISQLNDGKDILQVGIIMIAIGTLGTEMSKMVASLKKVSAKDVLTGLGDIALAIGGLALITAAFALIAPEIAPLIEAGTMAEVGVVLAAVGVVGAGMAALVGIVGKFKIQDVLTGIADMALAIGGLTAITAAFAAVAPHVEPLIEADSITKVSITITALGALGTVLTAFAGVAGVFPVQMVLMGLANITLVLGGFTALAAAFGALSKVEGFTELVESGGEVLSTLTGILGDMIGSFIGGALEGVTDSLPTIGTNIAGFAKNVAGVFTAFEGVNAESAANALNAIANFLLKMTANELLSFFTGEVDFSAIATGLGSLAGEGTSNFFTWVETIPEKGFTNATAFFTALDGIGLLPNVGGVAQLFTGTNDFEGVATGLGQLCSDNVKNFFTYVSGLSETAFTNATAFFTALDGIGKLPNVGGFAQFFTGTNDFAGVASGLGQLCSTNVKSFFSYVSELKKGTFEKVVSFFSCLDGIGGLPNVGGVAQLFTGTNDFEGVATGLGKFSAKSTKDFFTMVGDMKSTVFSNMVKLFEALEDVGDLNKEGFLEQLGELFVGEDNNLGEIATQLGSFWKKAKDFITGVGNVKDVSGFSKIWESVTQAIAINQAVKNIDDWSGMSRSGNMLSSFATAATPFFNTLMTLKEKTLEKIPKYGLIFNMILLADAAAACDLSNLPAHGTALTDFSTNLNVFLLHIRDMKDSEFGNINKFSAIFKVIREAGSVNEVDISTLPDKGTELSSFMSNVNGFFVGANELATYISDAKEVTAVLKDFFKAVRTIQKVDLPEFKANVDIVFEGVVKTVDDSVSSMVELMSELPSKMGTALKENSSALSDAVAAMWKDAVKASVSPVNKLLDGANFILKEFGSDKRVSKWQPYAEGYAKGTDGHRGGNALVNDGRGAELVQMPNGRMFIPRGRNVFMPNAPKGMKVLSAENTAKMFGRTSPTFRYADGNIDVWNFIDNASGLIGEITKGISYKGMSKFTANVGKGMVNTFSGAMKPWVEKLFEEFGAKGLADYVASAGVEQWRSTVIRALKMEGQYSEANVKRTLFQMQTESGGNPMAINLWDSNAKKGTPSKGLMQVIDPTFKAYARAGYDKNIYDPLSNILASIRYATSRYGSLARAYRGVGYSNGVGEVTMPSSPVRYSPESSIEGRTSVSEHNTYSPSFNITINGSDNPREMERQVKRWIKEAMEDMFTGMARKNKTLREV